VRNAGYLPLHPRLGEEARAIDARVFVRVGGSGGCSIDARDARLEVGHSRAGDAGCTPNSSSTCRAAAASRGARYRCRCAAAGGCAVRAKGLRVGEVVKEIVVEP